MRAGVCQSAGVRTLGIDLAAEPAGTALAVLRWDAGGARVESLDVGVDDAGLLAALRDPDGAVGVDCPVGWPRAFVDLVSGHHAGRAPVPAERAPGWRRPYVLRATDRHVHARTGLTPLSVSADRIAHAAIRLAVLLAEVGDDVDVARDGSGAVAEVYPAAALRVWGLPHRGYKGAGQDAARHALVDDLERAAPWLDLGPHGQRCREVHDALDAVLAALVARAVALGLTEGVPEGGREVALAEGWVHVPTSPLTALDPRRGGRD